MPYDFEYDYDYDLVIYEKYTYSVAITKLEYYLINEDERVSVCMLMCRPIFKFIIIISVSIINNGDLSKKGVK